MLVVVGGRVDPFGFQFGEGAPPVVLVLLGLLDGGGLGGGPLGGLFGVAGGGTLSGGTLGAGLTRGTRRALRGGLTVTGRRLRAAILVQVTGGLTVLAQLTHPRGGPRLTLTRGGQRGPVLGVELVAAHVAHGTGRHGLSGAALRTLGAGSPALAGGVGPAVGGGRAVSAGLGARLSHGLRRALLLAALL